MNWIKYQIVELFGKIYKIHGWLTFFLILFSMAINNYKITLIAPKAPLAQPLKKIQSSRINGPIKNLIDPLKKIRIKYIFLAINGFGVLWLTYPYQSTFNSMKTQLINKLITVKTPKKNLGFSEFLMEEKASKEFMAMNINNYVKINNNPSLGSQKTLSFEKLFNKKSFNDLKLAQFIQEDAMAKKVITLPNWSQEIHKYSIKYQPTGPIDSHIILLKLIYYSHNFQMEEFVNLLQQMPKNFINFTFQYLFSAYFIDRRDHLQQFVEDFMDHITVHREKFSIESPVYYFIKIIIDWDSLAGQHNIDDLNKYYAINNEIKLESVPSSVYNKLNVSQKTILEKNNGFYRNNTQFTKKIKKYKNKF